MKKVIETAKRNVRQFCKVNKIALNEKILSVPVYSIEEFFEGRDQTGFNYCEAEARNDLGKSEAFYLQIDDLTGESVIIYDKERMEVLDFGEKVQIIVHEFLHYHEAKGNILLSELEAEAEAEVLSIVIAFYANNELEDGLELLLERADLKDILNSYDNKSLGKMMLRKINEITRTEVKKYFK